MTKPIFDQDHARVFQAGSRGSYSFALGLSGIALACLTALPDACSHHNLASIYSQIIKFTLFASFWLIILGIFLAAQAEDIKNGVSEENKTIVKASDALRNGKFIWFLFMVTLPFIFIIFSFIFLFDSFTDLPYSPASALEFCAEPDKADSK